MLLGGVLGLCGSGGSCRGFSKRGKTFGYLIPPPPKKGKVRVMQLVRMIDEGQIDHPVCVRLKQLLYELFWEGEGEGGSGFPVFSLAFLGSEQKPLKKKYVNKHFTGLSRDFVVFFFVFSLP